MIRNKLKTRKVHINKLETGIFKYIHFYSKLLKYSSIGALRVQLSDGWIFGQSVGLISNLELSLVIQFVKDIDGLRDQ